MELGNAGKLWGTVHPGGEAAPHRTASAIGDALLALVQPDLFGSGVDRETEHRLAAIRRRRARTRRRIAAEAMLSEPWTLLERTAAPDAVALARRFLRRHPDRDRADPAPPLLTGRQEAALWHAEEEMEDERLRRDPW